MKILLLLFSRALRFFSINRYYLEPASPLKSLTNATQFGLAQSNGSTRSTLENGNHNSSATIPTTTTTNGTALWSLSPPNTLNLNGNNKGLPAPPSINNFQEQFTPDDNSLFNQSSNGRSTVTAATTNGISLSNSLTNNHLNNHHQNGISHATNGTGVSNNNGGTNGNHYLMNGFSRPTASASNQNVITKNSLNLQQSAAILENTNKFTPDADFVADFNSANIFNAQTTSANATPVTPLKATTTNVTNGTTNNHNNNVISKSFNGNGPMTNGNGTNGTTTNGFDDGSDANANFADFEHNTIYNAAGKKLTAHTQIKHPCFLSWSSTNGRLTSSTCHQMPIEKFASISLISICRPGRTRHCFDTKRT